MWTIDDGRGSRTTRRLSAAISRGLSSRMYRRVGLLGACAVLPALLMMMYDQAAQRRATRDQLTQENVRFARVLAAQTAGVFGGAARLLATLAEFPGLGANEAAGCQRLMASALHEHPDYINLAVVNRDGRVLCAGDPAATSVSLADRPWFQRVFALRAPVAGEYQLGRLTGRADIIIAHPMLDSDGAITRVIVTALDLQSLNRLMATRLLPGTTMTVFDRRRVVIARHPAGDAFVGKIVPMAPATLPAAGTVDLQDAVGVDGVRRLYVTVPVDAGFDTGVYVSV